MNKTTLSKQLIEVQGVLKENIEKVNAAGGNADLLQVLCIKADAVTKLARQYINAAQTLVRLYKASGDAAALTMEA